MGYVCLSQAQFPHEVRILGNCRENIPTALPKVLAVDRKLCCYGNNAETLAHSRRSRDDSQHH